MSENTLRTIREKKGISQLQLSYKTGISQTAISNIENGRVYPYPGWRKRIAKALNVPEKEIFMNEQEG